jgi:eukaryotic-like serine/threonine-protein kinase
MPEPRKPLRNIFIETLAIEGRQERAAYLEKACGTDVSLRQQIENLIQADAAAGGFLGSPTDEGGPQETQSYASSAGDNSEPALDKELDANTEKLGDSIGPFKLLQRIGEGGMGVVYMAEQDKPVHRRVAAVLVLTDSAGMRIEALDGKVARAWRTAGVGATKPHRADAGKAGRIFFISSCLRIN